MSEGQAVTDGDRERARRLFDHTYCQADVCECSEAEEVEAIAAALAEEREKARAPFMRVAEEFDTAAAEIAPAWPHVLPVQAIAARIRRAAEEIR